LKTGSELRRESTLNAIGLHDMLKEHEQPQLLGLREIRWRASSSGDPIQWTGEHARYLPREFYLDEHYQLLCSSSSCTAQLDRMQQYRQVSNLYFPHHEHRNSALGNTILDAELVWDISKNGKVRRLQKQS
jgi:hypothetical protein